MSTEESIKNECKGCELFSGTDCMMPTPEFGCVRDMEKELRAMRQTLVEISEMKIPYCDANDVANYMRDAAKESLRAAAEGGE